MKSYIVSVQGIAVVRGQVTLKAKSLTEAMTKALAQADHILLVPVGALIGGKVTKVVDYQTDSKLYEGE